MPKGRRVVVVGGGIAGISTAWHLTRAGGFDVVVLERERALGRHATAQNAAILRTSSDEPAHEALARESARFLLDPPRGFARGPLVETCGVIVAVRESSPEAAGHERRARESDDCREISAAHFSALAPHVRAEPWRAFRFAREGRLFVDEIVRAFAAGARSGGARIELGAAVRALAPDGRGVVLADGRTIESDATVLAAGAWAEPLARAAGSRVTLRPTRRHLALVAASAPAPAHAPIVWVEGDDPYYVRAEDGHWLACALDDAEVVPEELVADADVWRVIQRKCARFLVGGERVSATRLWAGIRTHATDGRFAVGPDPDVAGLVWVAGLGGHGMSCAPAVGALATEWLVSGASTHAAARALDPARFARAVQR